MSVESILRERAAVNTRMSLLPPEPSGRARVQEALDTLMTEINRLRTLQRREDSRRRARADVDDVVARARRRAAHREATRHLTITIDKTLFWEIASVALGALHGPAYAALERELTAIDDREKLSGGG